MIDLIFYRKSELIMMRVLNGKVFFATPHLAQGQMYPIDMIGITEVSKLKIQAIKQRIEAAKTEDAIADIIIDDMEQDGFILQHRKRF